EFLDRGVDRVRDDVPVDRQFRDRGAGAVVVYAGCVAGGDPGVAVSVVRIRAGFDLRWRAGDRGCLVGFVDTGVLGVGAGRYYPVDMAARLSAHGDPGRVMMSSRDDCCVTLRHRSIARRPHRLGMTDVYCERLVFFRRWLPLTPLRGL